MQKFISQKIVKKIVGNIPNGQFFTVFFIKEDGTLRKMTCQKGVKKYVKGTGTRKPNANLQIVYELDKVGYRSFNTNRVVYIKARGAEVTIVGHDRKQLDKVVRRRERGRSK